MKKYRLFRLSIVLALCAYVLSVDASVLYVASPQASSAPQEYTIDISIDADKAVNTIQGTLVVPAGAEYVRANDSNSIINLWIERPSYSGQTRHIVFSGVTPGGFSGINGHVISLIFKSTNSAQDTLGFSFDPANTFVYLNDGNGTKDSVTFKTKIKENVTQPNDTTGPENFTPILTRDPQLLEGKWVVLFQTQDKGSGIDHYEVQESNKRTPEDEKWKRAESPYVLEDQNVPKYVFVKAVDVQGNSTIATVSPESGWGIKLLVILCITLILILISKVYYKYRRKL
jgi:hypothetical protein